MSNIQNKYLAGFDDLNILLSSLVADESTPQQFVSSVGDFLLTAYANGVYATDDDIDEMHEIDVSRMFEVVNQKVADKDFEERLTEYYKEGNIADMKRVLETEYHRDFNQAVLDTAKKSNAKYKTWETMEDEKVRDSHFYLQGVRIPLDEKFVTIGGDSALAPGGFSDAENNVNCRCWLEIGK